MDEKTKEAVYVALTGGLFYYAAKHLKIDANAALIVGTAVGKILSVNIQKHDSQFT